MKFDVDTEVSFTCKKSIEKFLIFFSELYNDNFCFRIIYLQTVFTHPVPNAIWCVFNHINSLYLYDDVFIA